MFQISIIRDGVKMYVANSWNGAPFQLLSDAQAYIDYIENKPSHPWGRPAGWYKLIRENTIEFMGEKVILPAEILETRITENLESVLTEVRLAATYTIEIIDLDQDVAYLRKRKQQAIQTVRNNFQDKIDDTYDAMKVSILNAKAIQKLGEATQLSEAFMTMASSVDTATTALPIVKLCVKAIEKLAMAQSLPNKFENMMLVLDPLYIWRNETVIAIKACNSITELELISLIPPE